MSTPLAPAPFHYIPGHLPVLLSIPHCSTHVPASIFERLTADAQKLADTDWHVDRLYNFARDMGFHIIIATHSRFVVDLNRAPNGEVLYPGKFTTGLCPVQLFDGSSAYTQGNDPDAEEIKARVATYWRPYHDQLRSVIDTLKSRAERVVLFDAHSIRSELPKLFDGTLPDLNFGTADGASADGSLLELLLADASRSNYSIVHNGRFKGGYITRHYGNPSGGIHAVQLELAQHNYMEEVYPFRYDERKAKALQAVLKAVLARVAEWAMSGKA